MKYLRQPPLLVGKTDRGILVVRRRLDHSDTCKQSGLTRRRIITAATPRSVMPTRR